MIINGKKIADEILESFRIKDLDITLSVVWTGKDSSSQSFIRQKQKACQKVGIGFQLHTFKKTPSFSELKKQVQEIGKDPFVSGIVVQLPLEFRNKKEELVQDILNTIPYHKDVDCLGETTLGKFYTNDFSILPPVVGAVSYLFKKYKISLKGKHVVLVGSGRLVGKPLALWLLNQKATVSVVNKFSYDISSFTKKADILISGVGKSGLINSKMIKKGAMVIDAGSSEGNRGDIDYNVASKASYFCPVPNGLGPITVACLIENLLKL